MTLSASSPTLRPAEPADLPLIARMNRALILDEGHRNPMTLDQLEERARGFLASADWRIDLIEQAGCIAGFATWRWEEDIAEPSGQRIYLRQFFIAQEARGAGVGRRAFELLMAERFPAGARILLEVLHSNPKGQAFWARMGFGPYAVHLERRSGQSV
ncbi:GNAT family N-acetyltransferase [Ancylobacter sp. SL191]|jgi:GNAT superfamily N-acetyltransferase|uniref:GNAT family N-acetyltransferase n=1 Tax=Ancylobacter sp. SL191 TaxID=2995166 RepID=UPI002270E53C|nr:GNAT family N-acetyltransferase [Ancylobacter sp. SL191]WAC27536.1 GNAT family N-acetyltransferase [Ancylobacter sp. SL191]